ncbi:AAA family ATPase [Paenibacillus lautus]|uniref:AAA family ATPase n=1 Tax=Paenibacillus lautus TaxID=1401 RepID=UPI002DBB5B10|nr:AAA family ATPase [Paenibacillus lautus]MEC0310201.1 AAA family ATPase [Paenibacillus lautus]
MFKLKDIHIDGIGGIEDLFLSFNSNMNIICGPNGVGKTTILECIAQSFSYNSGDFLRKKSDHEFGSWEITSLQGAIHKLKVNNFHPTESISLHATTNINPARDFAKDVIHIKTHRTFNYIPLLSISNNSRQQQLYEEELLVTRGISAEDGKNWFIHRYMWSAHPDSITPAQKHNLEIAKSIFHKTDSKIRFSRVKADTYDILIKQNEREEIYFEYLSSGYKSVIYILLGLIKEIELRFANDNLNVEDYSGVILIDEIDLHLHPRWQANLLYTLKEIFPNAQFICTTHSAHIIQAADPSEIIPLAYDSEGKVIVRKVPSNIYGFQGWTVEEILTDVMGLEETRSPFFIDQLRKFELSLDNEDVENAREAYAVLDNMLHPSNHMRKLLSIQLAALGSDLND